MLLLLTKKVLTKETKKLLKRTAINLKFVILLFIMKRVFHKIASLLMAFVVLFSTMSFTIDMHYCGDTLVDTAIFHKVKTCGMEKQKSSSTSECSITKKDCCNDQQVKIDGQDELKCSFDQLILKQQFFVTAFAYSYLNLFDGLNNEKPSFTDYPPPLIVKQIFKLDESYLI